ncbi:MAG: TIGR03617 family F420-dependent LLM class oxidoreductase [Aldersonia sp.]|nr:TIGR03617 family F420-dependent LLM class oxidoreductase [Aldersonia sp.]
MKADFVFHGKPEDAPTAAVLAEEAGLDGFTVTETKHDAFITLALAATRTSHIELVPAVAIAFARNPMTLATMAYDVQRISGGRFTLGLGSQIRPHITKRFSMPWSAPAKRMRELVLAVQAIWTSWQTGAHLDFRGEFYTHTLMTPAFDPGPLDVPSPSVVLAGVGPHMVAVAAEVADGLICHPLISRDHLVEFVLPTVERVRRDHGRTEPFEMCGQIMVASGRTEEELDAAVDATRKQIAFYASTPAYRSVLERHDLGWLQDELNALSKAGRWDDMAALIRDDILSLFAVAGEPAEVVAELHRRFGGLLDRVSVSTAGGKSADVSLDILRGLA